MSNVSSSKYYEGKQGFKTCILQNFKFPTQEQALDGLPFNFGIFHSSRSLTPHPITPFNFNTSQLRHWLYYTIIQECLQKKKGFCRGTKHSSATIMPQNTFYNFFFKQRYTLHDLEVKRKHRYGPHKKKEKSSVFRRIQTNRKVYFKLVFPQRF